MENVADQMILEFSNCKIPINEKEVKKFLIERIKTGKTNLKYFGKALDGSIECNEGQFLTEIADSTYIHLYFRQEENASIKYQMDSEVVFHLLLSVLEKNEIMRLSVKKNIIDVHFK